MSSSSSSNAIPGTGLSGVAVPPPIGPVYRVAGNRGGGQAEAFSPFDPPSWHIPFKGRFDDPRISAGAPKEQCFRTIYFATELAGAFGETIQRFIPGPELLRKIFQGKTPLDPQLLGGIVPAEWLKRRWIGKTRLDGSLLFVDLTATRTLTALYHTAWIPPLIEKLGLSSLDISATTGNSLKHRELTQEIALYIYNQQDSHGQALYAGLKYMSHLNRDWECWAVYYDRLLHAPMSTRQVRLNDPELIRAATELNLRIAP